MQAAAFVAVRQAFAGVGVEVLPAASTGDDAVTIRPPDGSIIALDIKVSAAPSWAWISKLEPTANPTIVVADRIPTDAREHLNARGVGWLDRRGHLRFVAAGFFIDADVQPSARPGAPTVNRDAISGRSGLAAAAALLLNPDNPLGVTEISRQANLNASSISRAMFALADAQLAERLSRGRYRPLVPELFWALAEVWPRDRTTTGLTAADLKGAQLGAGIETVSSLGWAMAAERGAVSWGAPLVLTGDYPTLLYVPDETAIRSALALHPENKSQRRPGIALAVDPTGLIVANRFRPPAVPLPLAHPLFCALDLTAASRDREALEQWTPPDGFSRVW